MNDLISRQALMDDIKRYVAGTPLQEMFETIVDKQPTAYDVDKVVDRLEKLKSIRSMKDYTSTGIIHDYVDIKEVIEIVKGGGVDVL